MTTATYLKDGLMSTDGGQRTGQVAVQLKIKPLAAMESLYLFQHLQATIGQKPSLSSVTRE